jgi:integrase
VNFEERKIIIYGMKGQNNRYIPMNHTLYDILINIKGEGEPIPFTYKPYYVSHKIVEYYKLTGIKGANLHSLRKTFGSLLLQNNKADLYTVSRLLGHKSIKTTEKYYVDLLDENYRDSVNGLDEII